MSKQLQIPIERSLPRVLLGIAAPLTACLVMTLGFAQEEAPDDAQPEEVAAGLTGILPSEPPDDLDFEAFGILGGNWSDWSEQTAALVGRLYSEETADVPQQRQVIASLRSRLQTMENSLADRRFRSLWDPLTTMHGRLIRRVDLAEAILDTLELTPEKARRSRLQSAGAAVARAQRALESRLRSIPGGLAWLPIIEADRIAELMRNPADAEAALPVLRKAHSTLTETASLGAAQKRFLDRDEFRALAGAIGDYIARAEEEHPPLDEERLREELAALVEGIEGFEAEGKLSDVNTVESAQQAVADLSPDKGARIGAVIETHYRNYNFRVVSSEELLSRYVRETRRDSGPISEPVSGAYVTGSQNTAATTGADLRPSKNGALFDLTLNGVVRSSTVASASRANIWSSGFHRFVARRSVRFDGEKFTLGPRGVISVTPSISTTNVSTTYDRGFFASQARQRAFSAAAAGRPEAEQRARNSIRRDVLPEFEREAEEEFARANKDMEEQWNRRLREAKLEPVARQVSSTDRHLLWNTLVARPGEFAGAAGSVPPPPAKGVQIQLHETLLNAMFDRMDIAGRTMTNEEFRKEVEDYFAILFPSEKDGPAKSAPLEADPDQYVFAETDPIRFRVENGAVNLIIRTGIRQEGKEDIPTQKITVPLTFRLDADQVIIQRGSVQVAPIERPESRSEQIIRARIMGAKIERDLEDRTRERQIRISRGEDRSDLVLNIQRIQPLNGWVTVWAE